MFQSARIKLTSWYLLIILIISLLFSTVIYAGINSELKRFERASEILRERELRRRLPPHLMAEIPPSRIDPEIILETRRRLILTLIIINGGILLISAIAGYFLAGRTLQPIQAMVQEQDRFISDASHELKTPITALKSELEVNLRDKNITGKTREILTSNLEEVNSLQRLTEGLLTLSKNQISDSKTYTKLKVSELVNEALKKVTPQANSKNITITSHNLDHFVFGDKQSLEEVLIIILDNAVKYSTKDQTISITAVKINKAVSINIKDHGIGISKSDLPFIFDRSYRADKARNHDHSDSYGLGLSIAKQIINAHDGIIKVESRVNLGSTFKIILPKTA